MEKKNSDKQTTDLAKALQLALTLDQLRQNQNLADLDFARRVMKNLKEMPRIKPPSAPLKLSEIAPTIPKYEELPVPEETSLLARIKKLFKRKSGATVPA